MIYDLIIVGGSAAATAAGVYAARRELNFKIITKEFGGEVATSGDIGNWPGIPMTDGIKLAQQFRDHLASYNVEPEEAMIVQSVAKQSDGTFVVKGIRDGLGDPFEYQAKAVILTTGVHPRELTVPGEKEYRIKGVTYCTTCDGPLFKDKIVATVGGGNSALESALMMADIAKKVYVINKNAHFKGEQVLIDKLVAKPNVEILYNAKTKEIFGEQFVKGLKYTDPEDKEYTLELEGIFVHIGMVPNSGIVPADVQRDTFGQIKVNENMETSVAGLYAAGDVTTVPFKQIVIAAGQGCIATLSAVNYLNMLPK